MKAQFCPRCGCASPPDAKFCPACGGPRWVEGTDPLQATLVAGRYRLLDKIDESSVGPLYRAEDLQLGRAVAVRLLDPALALDGAALERARGEMRAIGGYASEHLVSLRDFGSTSEGRLFVAMDSPEGDSLRAALDREGQLAVPRVIDILQQIAETLSRPHASGWIHGDLRPKNVLLGTTGATGMGAARGGGKDFIRLLDFGLAQLLLSGARSRAASPRLTYGDPNYMAPEQVLGESVDGRADLHAIGVLGYEMLVGELPFAGTHHHPGEALERLLGAVRPSVRTRRPECPEWLDALLQRAMARRAEERFSDMEHLLGYLVRGGEAAPVELVAERARSDKMAMGGRASEPREPGPGEPETAMNLVASHALPPRPEAAAGAVALSVSTGPAKHGAVGRIATDAEGPAPSQPGGRQGARSGEGAPGLESQPLATQARSNSPRPGRTTPGSAGRVPSGASTPAAAEKAGEPPAGRPRGEPTDQFWFNTAPETLGFGEEEYADEGPRRNLGSLVGLIVGGVFLLLILAIALWPKGSAAPGPGSSGAPTGHP